MSSVRDLISITDEDIESLLKNYNSKYPKEAKTFCDLRKIIIKNLETKDFHAVAGSGKTTLLAFKIALILQKWPYLDRGMCILSHTNVAKDIIIKELQQINPYYSLEKFPHFIGTIQQFVDSFLALPYINSCVSKVQYVDNEQYWKKFERLFGFWASQGVTKRFATFEQFVSYLLNHTAEEYYSHLKLVNVEPKRKAKIQHIKAQRIQKNLVSEGFFTYEDMFKYASIFIKTYPRILEIIRRKFPLVIVDEAQDTTQQQHDILELCFANEAVVFQRIGDPDQAIYDFGSKDNISDKIFSRLDPSMKITETHRFCKEIAAEASRYSLTGTNIVSNFKGYDIKEISFNVTSPSSAIEAFVNYICANRKCLPQDPKIKIIGAQGENSEPSALDIQSYIPAFNKRIQKSKFRTSNLFQALEYIHKNRCGNFTENYEILVDCIAQSVSINEKVVSKKEFLNILYEKSQLDTLNNIIYMWLNVKTPIALDSVKQDFSCFDTSLVFDYNKLCDSKYREEEQILINSTITINGREIPVVNNSFQVNGITFYVDTIHGVKGETHDATLVLATKDKTRTTDIQTLRGQDKKNTYRAQRKKIYVAVTRPKYILAIAVPQS